MARVSSSGIQVEQAGITKQRITAAGIVIEIAPFDARVTSAGIVIEQAPLRKQRISAAGLMIEICPIATADLNWGPVTGVTEPVQHPFKSNWVGTGTFEGAGETEKLVVGPGQYMESEVVLTGAQIIELTQNTYGEGDTGTLYYRTGSTVSDCQAASWSAYTGEFDSLGYIQVRVEP